MPKLPNKTDLSVIILNYNSKEYLAKCLLSIKKSNFKKHQIKIYIADNNSSDSSFVDAKKIVSPNFTFIQIGKNIGFAAGNNFALKSIDTNSRYVLFLNPDTIVEPDTFSGMIEFLDQHPHIEAATCNIILALTGKTQPECHRDFPTPLSALLHFSGISNRQYFMEYLDYTKPVQINSCVGAFFMIRKDIGDKLGWWNEKYFFYGEDLDFCYKLKQNNFQLYFVPSYQVTHFQGISSGIKKTKSAASRQTKILAAKASTDAMRIFYQENLLEQYPLSSQLVLLGIKILEYIRIYKAKYL